MKKYLNIACGNSFVSSADWENIDYVSSCPAVTRANILGGLSTTEPDYEVIYCSHFVEHIPPATVQTFLGECRSRMRENSVFRVVVPDTTFLMKEFLKRRAAGEQVKAEYAFLCFLDQCVRTRGSGRLGEMNGRIAKGELPELKDYARYLLGEEAVEDSTTSLVSNTLKSKVIRVLAQPNLLLQKLEPRYVRMICALLPRAFLTQNVSFTSVGGRHLWMYDFEALKAELLACGFNTVKQCDYNSSTRDYALFEPLDSVEGQPRKGHHQLFVEATI